MESSNVLKITTNNVISLLTKTYISHIDKEIIYSHPAVFLHGQPGIGKSQSVYKIAKCIQDKTNKLVIVHDIRLLLFNPVDLRGIPVADLEERVAIWLKPQILNLDPSSNVVNIIFLDELNSAPVSIQTVAYQMALEKKVGEHKIPNNTFIIAAGNRSSDNSVVFSMPTALRNRFMHFELKLDLDEWLAWAKENCLNDDVIEFLDKNPTKFVTDNLDTSSNIIVTPRSWEMLSNVLNAVGGSLKDNVDIIASIVGVSLTEIIVNDKMNININDIIKGNFSSGPLTNEELIEVVELLETSIDKYISNKFYIANVLNYLNLLPMDFALRVFRKILADRNLNYNIDDLKGFKVLVDRLEGKE